MPFVSSLEMLQHAQREGYAIGAFNAENMEMMQAIVAAAELAHSPVIVQISASAARKYAPPALYAAQAAALASASPVPVALHLDHCTSAPLVIQALRAGFTSIMYDGSHEPFEDNVDLTATVVQLCSACNVPVEAELGRVGGKEDDVVSDDSGYTDPEEAVEFIARTGIQSLAVAIGTAHGIYKGTPALDLERLESLRERISIPLVLHGASGLSDDTVRACIRRGICKVNFATELRIAYSDAARAAILADADAFDPKAWSTPARDAVQALVFEKINALRA